MSLGRFFRAGLGAAIILAIIATAAVAAALPQAGKVYDTKGVKKGLSLTLITSVSNSKRLIAGPSSPPVGSQFALSTGTVRCPRAKPFKGFRMTPAALFSFPGGRLKPSGGRYRFAVSKTVHKETVLGSNVKPFTLKLKFTGVVVNAKTITGTVKVHGGPCTVKRAIPYTAELNKNEQVAPQA